MTPEHRLHFRASLEMLKGQLLMEIEGHSQSIQFQPGEADPNDRASHEWDTTVEILNRNRARKLIGSVEATIARIDSNDYGYCTNCGVEISLERLRAWPMATLCIDCKNRQELQDKVRGGS